jgi:hypothetical protein
MAAYADYNHCKLAIVSAQHKSFFIGAFISLIVAMAGFAA